MTTAAAFDEMVAGLALSPSCESDNPCPRPARWRINLHGCEHVNMCGQHKTAWLRRVAAKAGTPRCAH